MKKAIAYIRISTTDQSNFSLDSQAEHVTNYCGKQGYELLNIFRDNGQSAKNFDRANWKQLEAFVKQNYRHIDYLIVAKYDRFSRNMSEALQVIERLENEYNIVVLSVMEDLKMHPKSSVFLYVRKQMLLFADNELQVIKERTRMGMYQAARQGRYLHAAPFGYKNTRDAQNLPIIVVDEERAFIVKKAFQLAVAGMAPEAIRKELQSLGYPGKGKSAIPRLLSNYTYAGMVKVPASYDDP
ncbi:MAG TPA: recombinase family protein, partial [Flavipsychrobacter sp.]|nr:recombinase family protein [Flavipsychrobacter sp.]